MNLAKPLAYTAFYIHGVFLSPAWWQIFVLTHPKFAKRWPWLSALFFNVDRVLSLTFISGSIPLFELAARVALMAFAALRLDNVLVELGFITEAINQQLWALYSPKLGLEWTDSQFGVGMIITHIALFYLTYSVTAQQSAPFKEIILIAGTCLAAITSTHTFFAMLIWNSVPSAAWSHWIAPTAVGVWPHGLISKTFYLALWTGLTLAGLRTYRLRKLQDESLQNR